MTEKEMRHLLEFHQQREHLLTVQALNELADLRQQLAEARAEHVRDIDRIEAALGNPRHNDWDRIDNIVRAISAAESKHAQAMVDLEAAKRMVEAGERFLFKSADGGLCIEITKVPLGWSVYISHYGQYGPREGRFGHFQDLRSAYESLVAAKWLPAEGGGR